jgi:hypothetical protein
MTANRFDNFKKKEISFTAQTKSPFQVARSQGRYGSNYITAFTRLSATMRLHHRQYIM